MELKILSLNVRGLNKTAKGRQLLRWLHQQNSDVFFLQERYSSTQTIKVWEAERGGKIVESHGSNHSRGVMILFKLKINVSIEKFVRDKNGIYVSSEVYLDDEKFVFVNIYAPNDQTQQIHFLRDLSHSVLDSYANETLVLGRENNCTLTELDKRGGRSIEFEKKAIEEINNLIIAHGLIVIWRANNANLQGFTWSNPSMKIQCRLDYLLISKDMRYSLKNVKITPNVFPLIPNVYPFCIEFVFKPWSKTRSSGSWFFGNSIIQKCQETFNFGPPLQQWISVIYIATFQVAF